MEGFHQWDYCDFQGEDCIIYDIDDKSVTLAFWEMSYGEVPLHTISTVLLDRLKLKERTNNEGAALLKLCQPQIMSLSGGSVELSPLRSLVCLQEQNKVYNFQSLFSEVHTNGNDGYESEDEEEFLFVKALVKDKRGTEKKIPLSDLIKHYRASHGIENNMSTSRSTRVISLKM